MNNQEQIVSRINEAADLIQEEIGESNPFSMGLRTIRDRIVKKLSTQELVAANDLELVKGNVKVIILPKRGLQTCYLIQVKRASGWTDQTARSLPTKFFEGMADPNAWILEQAYREYNFNI